MSSLSLEEPIKILGFKLNLLLSGAAHKHKIAFFFIILFNYLYFNSKITLDKYNINYTGEQVQSAPLSHIYFYNAF